MKTPPQAHDTKTTAPRASAGRSRSAGDARFVAEVGARITERDRYLCRLLHEHRVLTTTQIADIAFTGIRRAEQRLAVLHHLAVVDRFTRRSWSGSHPYHWTLGPLGAAIHAVDEGRDPDQAGWRSDTVDKLARSQRLDHLVGTNGIFTSLLTAARHQPQRRQLVEWWSERRCAAEWGDLVRPDGYGIWIEDGYQLPFLLEYDNGTERLARLTAKLPGYTELAAVSGHPTWILFRFPSTARETNARRLLTSTRAPVATAVLHQGDDPTGPVWAPTTRPDRHRCRLIDLGDPTCPTGEPLDRHASW